MKFKNYIDEAKLKFMSSEWMKAVDELKAIGGAKIVIKKNDWDSYLDMITKQGIPYTWKKAKNQNIVLTVRKVDKKKAEEIAKSLEK